MMEIGDAWTDYLPESSRIVADWTSPIKCGNYNIDTEESVLDKITSKVLIRS